MFNVYIRHVDDVDPRLVGRFDIDTLDKFRTMLRSTGVEFADDDTVYYEWNERFVVSPDAFGLELRFAE